MVEIGEGTIGMWCVHLTEPDNGNVLAHIGYEADDKLVIMVRARWYVDNLLGPESRDKVTWWRIETKKPEREAVATFRRVREDFSKRMHATRSWELMKGARSAEEFGQVLAGMPGMHLSKLEDYRAGPRGRAEEWEDDT